MGVAVVTTPTTEEALVAAGKATPTATEAAVEAEKATPTAPGTGAAGR